MVAGACRTARVPCPSQRACDAAEATAEATTSSSLASAGPTARVPRPLQRARDAAEATAEATTSSSLASAGPGAKRKAPTAAVPNRRVMRKVDLDNDLADHSDDGATTEPNTEPASDDYESIKAMADADNEATSFRSEKTRGSVDILLIFRYQDDYIHPIMAKVLKGYWCKLCLKNTSVKRASCFLTGSNTSLRMHIARHHAQIYCKCCNAAGIDLVPCALFHTLANSSNGQTSLVVHLADDSARLV
ncbi:hypothetical protein EDB89DRAFT_2134579 [Lactarius sanguifluus]|nr:hypothetical protein EDB89DRAFT_2134579 [Lactarius sanguifluus]